MLSRRTFRIAPDSLPLTRGVRVGINVHGHVCCALPGDHVVGTVTTVFYPYVEVELHPPPLFSGVLDKPESEHLIAEVTRVLPTSAASGVQNELVEALRRELHRLEEENATLREEKKNVLDRLFDMIDHVVGKKTLDEVLSKDLPKRPEQGTTPGNTPS